MAAGLDWKNVAAPDLSSGSLQGLDMFSRLISSAGNRMSRGLTGVQDRANERAVLEVTKQIAGLTPEEIQAGLRDGSFLNNPNLRAADIATIQQRAFDAARFSDTMLDLGTKRTDVAQRDALDKAGATMADVIRLDQAGQREEADQLASTLDYSQLGYKNIRQFTEDRATGFTNFQNWRGGDQRFAHANSEEARRADDHSFKVDDRKAEQEAQNFIASALRGGWSGEQIMYQAADDPNLSARARYFIQRQFGASGSAGGSGGGDAGGGYSGGLGAPVTGGDPYNIVYGYGQYGQPDKPLTEMTAGEWVSFGRDVLIPATRGKVGAGPDKGTSAMGAYQITQETLQEYAPKVLGANWQTQVMGPEQQEAIAKAIFEDRKGTQLHKTWAGLPERPAGYYANKSWDEVRGEIVRAEGTSRGMDERQFAGATTNAHLAGSHAGNQQILQYVATRGEAPMTAQQVAAQRAGGNRYYERGLGELQALLNERGISGLNMQAIALLAEQNSVAHGKVGDFFTTLMPGDGMIPLGDGRYIKKSTFLTAATNAEQLATSAAANQATASTTSAGLQQARAREQQLVQEIERIARNNNGNMNAGRIPELQQELTRVRAQLQAGGANAGDARAALHPQVQGGQPAGTSSGSPAAPGRPAQAPNIPRNLRAADANSSGIQITNAARPRGMTGTHVTLADVTRGGAQAPGRPPNSRNQTAYTQWRASAQGRAFASNPHVDQTLVRRYWEENRARFGDNNFTMRFNEYGQYLGASRPPSQQERTQQRQAANRQTAQTTAQQAAARREQQTAQRSERQAQQAAERESVARQRERRAEGDRLRRERVQAVARGDRTAVAAIDRKLAELRA